MEQGDLSVNFNLHHIYLVQNFLFFPFCEKNQVYSFSSQVIADILCKIIIETIACKLHLIASVPYTCIVCIVETEYIEYIVPFSIDISDLQFHTSKFNNKEKKKDIQFVSSRNGNFHGRKMISSL